jgi:NTE family protein
VLSDLLDVFRLKQYFDAITAMRELAATVREDAGFLNTVRRALLTLPGEEHGATTLRPFPPFRSQPLSAFQGVRFGLVSTGGSGALASLVGAFRACAETGVRPAVMSVCSGSALFGFPLGAGLSIDRVCRFTLGLRARDFVDLDVAALLRLLPTGGRGFVGIIRGEHLEQTCRRLVGDMRLGDLAIPTYAPIWNIEENRVEYVGPRTYPELPVAIAMRVAISLPLFIAPVRIGEGHWCDGGIVDIFPVAPVLDIEDPCEAVLALNCFYPPEFAGERITGWKEERASILHVASQVRTSQQAELARVNLARLRRHSEVLMIDPVPYERVRGTGFYEQFLNNTDWPGFMRMGRGAALAALRAWRRQRPDGPADARATGAPQA